MSAPGTGVVELAVPREMHLVNLARSSVTYRCGQPRESAGPAPEPLAAKPHGPNYVYASARADLKYCPGCLADERAGASA